MRVECVVCGRFFSAHGENCFVCSKECTKKYHKMYITTVYRTQNNVRNSREIYSNLPEKIQAIKEKYKNGIPKGELEKWLKIN